MPTPQDLANAKQVAKEVTPIIHPRVTIEFAPEAEKILVIKIDSAGRESKIEFPYEKLGRELEFKGPLPVQVRTYFDEVAAGVKAGIHLQKKKVS